MKCGVRSSLPLPLPQVTKCPTLFNLDIRKGQAELLPNPAPVHIDHLGPGAGVDVLPSIWPNPVHGPVGVPKNNRPEIRLLIQDLTRVIF